jgi:signal transduction histidine kinase
MIGTPVAPTSHAHLDALAQGQPVHVIMARLAAAVRGSAGAVAALSALLGIAPPASLSWVGPAVAVLVAWTAIYVYVALTRGLRAWAIAVDVALISAMGLVIGRIVAEAPLAGGWNWLTGTASMVVVCAQLAGSPARSIPAGLVVAASMAVGMQLAGAPTAAVLNVAVTTSIQAMVSAAVMVVATRTGRAAASAFAELEHTERRAAIRRLERSDEASQLRLIHNGPLTTLAMALHADHATRMGALIRQRAATDLERDPALTSTDQPSAETERLDERLAQVVVWYEQLLAISATLPACPVPAAVADAMAGAAAEALENVVRHAGVDRAEVALSDRDGKVAVTVTDDGRGFDPHGVPPERFGVRESVTGALLAVGGQASVHSRPEGGTEVRLEWCRD